jgi:hypothetical protein
MTSVRAYVVGLLSLSLASASSAQPAIEPLSARIDDRAAQRFADLWRSSRGKPSSAEIQAQYLAHGGRGIEVFTPGRIGSAERLAAKIAASPDVYRDAVERCLPWVEPTNAQLRSTYLGLKGLLPSRPLPQIAVVVGANNSGGTAAPGIQVIGLEVICRSSKTRAEFEERMRQFFAHETVHTFQWRSEEPPADMLMAAALAEGTADFVTTLVTGRVPNAERDSWARTREAWIWREFQSDAARVRAGVKPDGEMDAEAQAAFRRWFANAGSPPAGWPDELGYWVGMRIAEAYVAAAADGHVAINELLDAKDPTTLATKSGYGRSFKSNARTSPAR